jgi:peptidyl-prolyl cis-trans isomerase C
LPAGSIFFAEQKNKGRFYFMRIAILIIGLVSFLVCGCDKLFPGTAIKSKPETAVSTTKSSSDEINVKGLVLARVNNWAIGDEDFRDYLKNVETMLKPQGVNVNTPDFKKSLLEDLVRIQILSQVALEKGLDKDADVIRAMADYKSTLLASRVRVDLEKNSEITLLEARNFYDKNKQLMKRAKEIKLRELAVKTESEAKDISIRLLQGEDFGTIARQVSVLPSAKDAGLLEFMGENSPGKFDKYWEIVKALDKGEKSSAFKGNDGNFYIVKVEDVRGGQEIPFAEVEAELKQALKMDKIEQAVNEVIEGYKKRARVEINEELIK